MDSLPTPPTPSSPPSYTPTSASVPQSYPQPPAFRQRKSSTIISLPPPSADNSGSSSGSLTPSTSPVVQSSSLYADQPYDQEQNNAGRTDERESDEPHLPAAHALPFHMRNNTLERCPSSSSSLAEAEEGEATPLLSSPDENGVRRRGKWYQGPLFVAAVQLGVLFAIFTLIVVGTFYWGMPKLDKEDRDAVKLPKSFADLQALNTLFQKYKHRYPYRILACGVVSYLFVQTFSLPGSMYISILFGAAYGIMYGLLLSCLCESFGSLFCYTLSSLLAPPLLALPFYRARVETWRTKIMGDPKKGKEVTWDGVFAFLIVLRIAPFPPHWVANFVAPHLGIGMFLFWCSVFIGIAPVSVIHVTIGSSLDSMTSAADFHILSLRNILGLCAVVVAVLIPVGLKRVFRKDLGDLGEAEEVFQEGSRGERDIDVPPVGQRGGVSYHAIDSGVVLAVPSRGDGIDMRTKLVKGKGRALEIIEDVGEEDEADYAYSYSDDSPHLSGSGSPEAGPSSRASSSFSGPRYHPQGGHAGNGSHGHVHAHGHGFEVYDPEGRVDRVEVKRYRQVTEDGVGAKPYRPNTLKGYGSIEPAPVPVRDSERVAAAAWWPWARGGVA
ncbi:hypothetical protein IAT38_006565 [Cryptococcus sp. DSM 104549]